ncbi:MULTISPECIES: hypothetical protein [Bradyrhizobium]|uniref:Uncharacterized protein n=1 Tax=Bradyrhizobium elkanii TaxID=29448 RepID=A0A4U6S962_BRAEL|nr:MULTISPECIES: hypothetical protein [Bradyrhizobium]MTV17228.1 hypothetical protein [Bradyrhizobium sp. BR2003]TKV83663.1 hypothetical protein FDV58_00170 [Bradyrhizobium elkanii]
MTASEPSAQSDANGSLLPDEDRASPEALPTTPGEKQPEQVSTATIVDPLKVAPDNIDTVLVLDECFVAEACIDRFLGALYTRAPKTDWIVVYEKKDVIIKRKRKLDHRHAQRACNRDQAIMEMDRRARKAVGSWTSIFERSSSASRTGRWSGVCCSSYGIKAHKAGRQATYPNCSIFQTWRDDARKVKGSVESRDDETQLAPLIGLPLLRFVRSGAPQLRG